MLLFQTSREIIFCFQHFIQVCFYFLGKKLGGAWAPPAYHLSCDAIFLPGGTMCNIDICSRGKIEQNRKRRYISNALS